MLVELPPWSLCFVFFSFLIAGFGKGVLGFGLPLIAISLLSTAIPVELALALNAIPPLLLNVLQIGSIHALVDSVSRFWAVLLGLGIGVAVGAALLGGINSNIILALVGTVTLLFCLLSLLQKIPAMPVCQSRPLSFATGGLAGLASAFTSVAGPILVMYLVAIRAEPAVFRRGIALMFLVVYGCVAIAFARVGFLDHSRAILGALATLPAGLGMWVGTRWARRLNSETFRSAVLVGLAVLGLNLLRRALL